MDGGRPRLAHRRGARVLGHDRRRPRDEPRRRHRAAAPGHRRRGVRLRRGHGAGMLDDVLTATDPATPVWTWSSDKTPAFVAAADGPGDGRPPPRRRARRRPRAPPSTPSWRPTASTSSCSTSSAGSTPDAAPLDGSVHLHCTDVAGEWLVVDDADGADVVTREHAKGDAAVRGPAHDLLLVLWRRQPLDAVEVIGDRAVAERLIATDPSRAETGRGASQLVEADLGDPVVGLLAQDQRRPLPGREDVLAEVAAVDAAPRCPRPSPAPPRR